MVPVLGIRQGWLLKVELSDLQEQFVVEPITSGSRHCWIPVYMGVPH